MYSTSKIIRTISLIGAFAFVTLSPTARAVDPPPDGGYPNQNTAEGEDALFSLTRGTGNTAIGFNALFSNTTGVINTANGNRALFSNTTGDGNTANGSDALYSNTSGTANSAHGWNALKGNTTGGGNTANGVQALFSNTGGSDNTANGLNALFSNTTGLYNTADGESALASNTTGSSNIAVGFLAGAFITTGDNNIDIGNAGVATDANAIRIGTAGTQTATFIAGIRETPLTRGAAVAVGITVDGQLGVRASSAQFKEAIKPMDKVSEAIFSLEPVTFRYKKALDPTALPQFGLVAEQVAKVNPDLVARDAEGKPFTVRYDEVNAMLLNEFLKEHHTVQELKEEIADLTATVKAQAAQIQKVSDQLGARAPAPRVAADN